MNDSVAKQTDNEEIDKLALTFHQIPEDPEEQLNKYTSIASCHVTKSRLLFDTQLPESAMDFSQKFPGCWPPGVQVLGY